MRTDDLRIRRVRPLIAPAILAEDVPLTEAASTVVANGRRSLEAILDGHDARLAVVVGPCSIHDPVAAIEYARTAAGRWRTRLPIDCCWSCACTSRNRARRSGGKVSSTILISTRRFTSTRGCVSRGSCSPTSRRSDCRPAPSSSTPRSDSSTRTWSAGARSAPAPPRVRSIANSRLDCRCRSASRTAPTATCRWRSTHCSRRRAVTCSRR